MLQKKDVQNSFLIKMVVAQKKGDPVGVYSVCSANKYVIEACMIQAKKDNSPLLIEATSNQVNQFGGYMGMNPAQFVTYVKTIAEKMNFPWESIILGGDHLGPNAWQNESAESAMDKSRDLVRDYVNPGDIIEQVNGIKNLSEDSKQLLISKLDSISQIISETPNMANYDRIKQEINTINETLNTIHSNISHTALSYISNSKTDVTQSGLIVIIVLIIGSLLSILTAIVITISISEPLKEMEGAAKSLAVGNLSKNITAVGCPEVTGVVNGLNQAISGLRELVQGINSQSTTLYTASNELKNASSETGKSAAEVARAMGELAKGASEQAEQVSQVVNSVHQLSEVVQKVSADMENIAISSEKVAQSAKAGQKSTFDVASQINELYDTTKEVASVIDVLSTTSGEISEITSVIHGIAEQTTLLALNASIEAARAGEHGKGFGVVARETGKLAEQSKQAASLISDLITQMKIRTDRAVEVMEKGISRVEEGKNRATEAYETFDEIFKALMANVSQINAIAVSTKKMAQNNDEVNVAISAIAAISEESMSSTEEVSATSQQQSASVQEVSALAENLTQIADSLRKYVAVFELGNENKID